MYRAGRFQAQRETECRAAEREHDEIDLVRADMSKPLPFDENSFDRIFHRVSNCYVAEVEPIWRECCRILKPCGALLAGMDNGVNFWSDEEKGRLACVMPCNPLENPEHRRILEEQDGGMQFSHSIDELIGGQRRAGFRLTDAYEDTNGSGKLETHKIPTFWATRAVRLRAGGAAKGGKIRFLPPLFSCCLSAPL